MWGFGPTFNLKGEKIWQSSVFTTVFDGAKKLITHFNVVSDGTGSTTKIVDVSGPSNNGKTLNVKIES